jgi:alcohol dehydrogenase (cytochrome c)
LFLPLNEFCAYTTPVPLDPGQSYTGGGYAVFSRIPVPGSDGNVGRVDAIRLTDRSTVWSYRHRAPATGGVLPTAGGVVFAGAWDRVFRAWDDRTGTVLWQIRTNNAVNSFPISYSVNGKQYVAVAVGNGSGQGLELASLTPEIALPDGGSVLWVFALPDQP